MYLELPWGMAKICSDDSAVPMGWIQAVCRGNLISSKALCWNQGRAVILITCAPVPFPALFLRIPESCGTV